jgi:SAM-dependent methyltransferase
MVQVAPRPSLKECSDPINEEHERYLERAFYKDELLAEKGGYVCGGTNKKEVFERAKEIISIAPNIKGKNVLEIGCYGGSFLRAMRDEYGCNVIGIERDKKYAQICSEYFGIKVLGDPIETIDNLKDSFELTVLFEVIEHLLNPLSVLKKVNSMNKKGSIIAISTPNYASEAVEYWGKNFSHFSPPGHINWFSPKTISLLLYKSGYSPIYIRTEREPLNWVLKTCKSRLDVDRNSPEDKIKYERKAQKLIADFLDKLFLHKVNFFSRQIRSFPDNIIFFIRDKLDYFDSLIANRVLKGSYLIVYAQKIEDVK